MTAVSADNVLYGILALVIIENAIDIYMSLRQVKVYRNALKVPRELTQVMTEEAFHKARIYGLEQENFGLFKVLLMDVLILCGELYVGLIARMWYLSVECVEHLEWDASNEIIVSCVFILISNLLGTVKSLPFKLYRTFGLEQKHGFNKQTFRFFVWDQLKSFLVTQVLMLPIVAAIIYIVQIGGNNFFIWLWVFTSVISLVLLTIYPIFIAPLFDKYTPLEHGPLRLSIERLAESLKFPLTKLYVVEGSKRSSHSNAYFYGLWNSKRIVLFDTLLLNKGKADDTELTDSEKGKGCTDEEVLAVIGHELGHWKLGHVTKNIVIMEVQLLLMFLVFGYLFKFAPFYEALGFHVGDQPILVGLLIVFTYVLAPYNAIVNVAMTMLSRRYEYQADEFAHKLGFGEQLGRALIKLNLDNLGFPVYDWLYSSWNHSHPPLLQRLGRLKELTEMKKEQ